MFSQKGPEDECANIAAVRFWLFDSLSGTSAQLLTFNLERCLKTGACSVSNYEAKDSFTLNEGESEFDLKTAFMPILRRNCLNI